MIGLNIRFFVFFGEEFNIPSHGPLNNKIRPNNNKSSVKVQFDKEADRLETHAIDQLEPVKSISSTSFLSAQKPITYKVRPGPLGRMDFRVNDREENSEK